MEETRLFTNSLRGRSVSMQISHEVPFLFRLHFFLLPILWWEDADHTNCAAVGSRIKGQGANEWNRDYIAQTWVYNMLIRASCPPLPSKIKTKKKNSYTFQHPDQWMPTKSTLAHCRWNSHTLPTFDAQVWSSPTSPLALKSAETQPVNRFY